MFKKAYIEITNICNLSCSFCHGTKRAARQMTLPEFELVLRKLKGHTRFIYLHILGEPLTHPELGKMLESAEREGFKVCLTTNGTLLKAALPLLEKCSALHKVSVSLHSFEANASTARLDEYIHEVLDACKDLSQRGVICALRLWNDGGEDRLNEEIFSVLRLRHPEPWDDHRQGYTIGKNLYLESAEKFDWPDANESERNVQFCMGLRDQIGILSDGTLIPCCLDADGEIALGNLFSQSLEEIIASPRAKALYNGFSNRSPTEPLCRKCGYATRFNK